LAAICNDQTVLKGHITVSVKLNYSLLLQSVGSALPGFVHGILFVALTKEVRQTMMKGFWNGIRNCEVCIYDRSCGMSACCCKRKPTELATLISNNQSGDASTEDILSEYDVVLSPDPTSSVSIMEVPELPRFATHFSDEDSAGETGRVT
jgi:hypothetical protein